MNVLIVYAHEEPKSFNGAMRDTAVRVLEELGHKVEVSDLYAMQFNPVGGKHDFTALTDPDYFKYGVEQTKASEAKTFAADVATEQEKLLRADFLIFQFPLWWFGQGVRCGPDLWWRSVVFQRHLQGETGDAQFDDRRRANDLQSTGLEWRNGHVAVPDPTRDVLFPGVRRATPLRGLVGRTK